MNRASWAGILFAAVALALPGARWAAGEVQDFGVWLNAFRADAERAGISPGTLDAALEGVEPIERVVELDRSQPEFTLTLDQYLERIVSDTRVERGRQKFGESQDLLLEIERRFPVQPQIVVALWGIETDYGRISGGFPVVSALATLAFDGRRSAYFRGELLDALRILDAGHIPVDRMQGSWAGAMGQPQFMPSSFLRFAVDFDGDGRKDIWENRPDVLASAANYLSQSGWIHGQKWGRQARLPSGFAPELLGLETQKRLSEWQRLGVRRADGRDLPRSPDLLASVVQPDGAGGRAYLAYNNYRTVLKWNRSHLFAIAVGTLGDRIAAR
jgi:membrane-bound lytic murein transglycosylase B